MDRKFLHSSHISQVTKHYLVAKCFRCCAGSSEVEFFLPLMVDASQRYNKNAC